MKKWVAAVAGAIIITVSGTALGEPMTKEQGDAILKQLGEIKQLLLQQQKMLTPPAPRKLTDMTIKERTKHVLGKNQAPVTMVAFTDFQCPYCAKFEAVTFPDIKKKYIDTGKLRFILHDFPLDFHPQAMQTAEAVYCAGDQGKYWEMKDLVFKNQKQIDFKSLVGYAKSLSLNIGSFTNCVEGGRHREEIREETKMAQSLGVNGTPTFVVGKSVNGSVKGKVIVGAQPTKVFEEAIEKALKDR